MIHPYIGSQTEYVRVQPVAFRWGYGMDDKIPGSGSRGIVPPPQRLPQAVADIPDLIPGFYPGVRALVIKKNNRPLILFQFLPVNLGKQGEGNKSQYQ
jgi:hypothetical protein